MCLNETNIINEWFARKKKLSSICLRLYIVVEMMYHGKTIFFFHEKNRSVWEEILVVHMFVIFSRTL